MVNQLRTSPRSNFQRLLDITMIGLGVVGGGVLALIGIWLWFEFQADPDHSALGMISTLLVDNIPLSLREFYTTQSNIMGLPLTGQTSAYWYMARGGGILAFLLLWLSVLWGLLLSSKLLRKRIPAALLYGMHEFLAILAIIFSSFHTFILLGDQFIGFNIFQLIIPFNSPYKPFWTGLGSIALYLILTITASSYLRKQIGQKTWRILHFLTFAAFIAALGHGLMAGSDSGLPGMKLIYGGTGLSILFLVYYRLLSPKP